MNKHSKICFNAQNFLFIGNPSFLLSFTAWVFLISVYVKYMSYSQDQNPCNIQINELFIFMNKNNIHKNNVIDNNKVPQHVA